MKTKQTFLSIALVFTLGAIFSFDTYAGKTVVHFSVSETDADIYIDGKLIGKGNCEILILKNTCVTVRVEKLGFVKETLSFCNKKNSTPPPSKHLPFRIETRQII